MSSAALVDTSGAHGHKKGARHLGSDLSFLSHSALGRYSVMTGT
jgi:hypothetical protein